MTEREVLEIVINSNKQDLANAISARDSIATENVETKIEAKLAEARKTISETEYAEHDRNLADANKVIELMNILITRKENALAELVAAEEQVVVNQNIEEGV